VTRVLVVDDEPQIVRALRINLRARGYEVDAAPDGRTALDLAARRHPDVIVLDLGADVRLTPTEWHVLEVLVRNAGRLVSQQQLLREVWGPSYANETGYLRVYLAQLRRKLEKDPSRPRHLITEPGMGYRFER
jgi:two-component system KDP operon response regulator KdpE